MERTPEPELMDTAEQAAAYAQAEFGEPHDYFVDLFQTTFGTGLAGTVLDLGCGPADVTMRFARAYPCCRIHGVDGAEAMLAWGRQLVAEAGLEDRITLWRRRLPAAELPLPAYDGVISNSLLHHLADPRCLWAAVQAYARPGTPVLVMDLMRPATDQAARALVVAHAADAVEVLARDFYHSLHAAYTVEEVAAQLDAAGLANFHVRPVSDRHLAVSGFVGQRARRR